MLATAWPLSTSAVGGMKSLLPARHAPAVYPYDEGRVLGGRQIEVQCQGVIIDLGVLQVVIFLNGAADIVRAGRNRATRRRMGVAVYWLFESLRSWGLSRSYLYRRRCQKSVQYLS